MKKDSLKRRAWIAAAFSTLALLASCNSGEDSKKDEAKEEYGYEDPYLKELKKNGKEEPGKGKEANTSIQQDIVDTLPVKEAENKPGGAELKKQNAEEKKRESEPPFYEKYLKDKEDPAFDVTLSFDAAVIGDVIPAFSQLLGFNYILDPQVKGAVTMNVNSKMTKKELWKTFEQILWLSGAYCSPEGDTLHVLPFKNMPQERGLVPGQEGHSNVEVSLIKLKKASSKDLIEKIKPFLTEGATAMDIPHQNALLIVEAPSNMAKLFSLAKVLDQKNKAEWAQSVIRCQNVSATRIKDELASVLPVLGFSVSVDSMEPDPGSIHLTSLERLQALVASAANEEAIKELKEWVSVLDKSDIGEQERVFIYKVINGKADELTQALSVIFPTEGSTLSASSSSGGTSSSSSSGGSSLSGSSSLKSSSSSSSSMKNAPVSQGASAAQTQGTTAKRSSSTTAGNSSTGPASVFDVPVKIFADAVHNRMVIRTTPRTYAMVKALLNSLDTVPAQVLLQVMVAEITLTNDTQFGIEFSNTSSFSTNSGENGKTYTSLYKTNYADLSPGKADQTGFSYWFFQDDDPNNKFAYLKAMAGKGKVEVVSSPQVLVTSHKEAKISVGNRVPIITNEITDTASVTANQTAVRRSVQYEETGIILNITPHVTKGGLITFDLDQTVSDAIMNKTSTIDSPEIQERVLKTSMSLRDGRTLIIGGLIRERAEDTQSTVPFISSLPLVGRLMGTNEIKKNRTELLVMITGRIITEENKLEELTRRYKEAVESIKKLDKLEKGSPSNIERDQEMDTIKRLLNL